MPVIYADYGHPAELSEAQLRRILEMAQRKRAVRRSSSNSLKFPWDPERDLDLNPLDHRSIQVGLGGEAVRLYVSRWIQRITDVTGMAHSIHGLVAAGRYEEARGLLPEERAYPLAHETMLRICATGR